MSFHRLLFLCVLLAAPAGFGQGMKVLVNHIGYEQDGPKRAVIVGHAGDDAGQFKVINCSTGVNAPSGTAIKMGPVDQWKDWCFWTAEFSSIKTEGTYL